MTTTEDDLTTLVRMRMLSALFGGIYSPSSDKSRREATRRKTPPLRRHECQHVDAGACAKCSTFGTLVRTTRAIRGVPDFPHLISNVSKIEVRDTADQELVKALVRAIR